MTYREPNEANWKPLNFDDDYSLGSVWQRFESLAKWDPYVAMLSDHVINRLCAGLTSPECLGTKDRLRVKERAQNEEGARELAYAYFGLSALTSLLTVQFKEHIVDLLIRAMFPKGK